MRRGCLALYVPLAAIALVAWAPRTAHAATPPTYVYFDQNEEEEFWSTDQAPYSGLPTQHLDKQWDYNGQVCVLPDGSGRFTSGYNPTGKEQKANDGTSPNGGLLLPHKQPPVGVAIYNRDGSFTGQDLYVPGAYKLTATSAQWLPKYGVTGPDAGGDVPPDTNGGGAFNNNGTFTGCTIGAHGNLFAVDLGTSQGSFPPNDNGRLLEWFAPDYTKVCIVYGPTSGGDVPPAPYTTHHVDGHGGLQQPGILASDADGNVYVPVDEAGSPVPGLPIPAPAGKVLKFAGVPATPADCPGTAGNQTTYHVVTPTTFIDATANGIAFPAGIARDPVCKCWAVDNVLSYQPGPAVGWFDNNGQPVTLDRHVPIPANFGTQFSPFGLAFDPQGDLFVVDIHVQIDPVGTLTSLSPQIGPANNAGQLLEFTFTGPVPSTPTTIASGENFPVGVSTCTPSVGQVCPAPAMAATSTPGSTAAIQSTAPAATTAAVTATPNTGAAIPGPGGAAAAAGVVALLASARRVRRRRGRGP